MSYPDSQPGLIIRYAYHWKRERAERREDGSNDRPCAIVLSIADGAREREVLVLPITRTPPEHANDGIEISPPTKTAPPLGFRAIVHRDHGQGTPMKWLSVWIDKSLVLSRSGPLPKFHTGLPEFLGAYSSSRP